jgi:hypothetical protein
MMDTETVTSTLCPSWCTGNHADDESGEVWHEGQQHVLHLPPWDDVTSAPPDGHGSAHVLVIQEAAGGSPKVVLGLCDHHGLAHVEMTAEQTAELMTVLATAVAQLRGV